MSDLRALAEKATSGPWYVGYDDGSGESSVVARDHEDRLGLDAVVVWGGNYDGIEFGARPANAAYIAAASPDVILRLLDVVDAARAVLDRAIEFFDEDDLEPESSFAMHVVMRARDAYALRAALDRLDETGKPG